MRKIIYALLFIFSWSCKPNTEKIEKNKDVSKATDTISRRNNIKIQKLLINGEKYVFYRALFQTKESHPTPEMPEEEIIKKFKKMNIELSKDTISIDGTKSHYTTGKMDSKKFFMRQYLYEYYSHIYDYALNINLKKNVNYLVVDIESSEKSPFKDYFMEAGYAIFIDNSLVHDKNK